MTSTQQLTTVVRGNPDDMSVSSNASTVRFTNGTKKQFRLFKFDSIMPSKSGGNNINGMHTAKQVAQAIRLLETLDPAERRDVFVQLHESLLPIERRANLIHFVGHLTPMDHGILLDILQQSNGTTSFPNGFVDVHLNPPHNDDDESFLSRRPHRKVLVRGVDDDCDDDDV